MPACPTSRGDGHTQYQYAGRDFFWLIFKTPRCVCALEVPTVMSIFLAPGPCSLPSCAVRCVTCGPRHRVDSMGPSPPGPVALLGCTVHRVVRGPLHGAGPTDLCRGPRPPELGSTFLGPRCPAGSLPSAPGPAPSEAARLGAPSVPGQGEAVLLPTWEQEGRMRSPALPSAYLQNQAPHSGAVSSHRGPGGRSHSSPSATPGSARPLSQGPWQEHCSQGQTHASR